MTPIRSLGIALLVTLCVFAGVVFHGRVLAIGDGLIESVAGFFAPYSRWQPFMFGGFPIYADPNKAYWYPLRLLHFVPNGFNAYIICAYAIAAWATYGYVRAVANSVPAGIASASAFAFGGFLVSHLGHPMIIEPACWFCAAIWSLDSYLRFRKGRWLVTLSASVFLCLAAGQSQVAAFTFPLLLGYLVCMGFERSLRQTASTYFEGALAIVLGAASAAMAWIPTIALITHSVRSGLDFASFVLYSLPVSHIPLMLIYPFAGGGGARSIYHGAVVTAGNFVETANYVPFAALVLTPFALLSGRRRLAVYWIAIASIAIALAVGDALPFAALTFQAPGFNLFRIPGRHAFEFTFAVAVLAGLGVSAVGRPIRGRSAVGCSAAIGIVLVAIATADVYGQDPKFAREPSVTIFMVAIAVQILVLLTAASLRSRTVWRPLLAGSAVAVGAAIFVTTAYWRDDSPAAAILQTPPYVQLLQHLPIDPGQRVYTEGDANHVELRPNLPNIWGVPEMGGYTPLQFAASRIFLQTGEDGRLLNVDSPLIDAAAVRYAVTPAQPDAELQASAPFASWDLNDFLAAGRANAPRSLTFGLHRPRMANRILIVTALGTSVGVGQGVAVATVTVRGASGGEESMPLRAGVETAEFAYDRPDVLAVVRHRKAPLYEHDGALNWYECVLRVGLHEPVVSIKITVTDPVAALNVRKMSLVDESTKLAYPFSADANFYGDPGHFRHVTDVGGVSIFENLRSRPAIWIARGVPSAFDLLSDDAMAAFRERLMRMDLRSDATTPEGQGMPAASGHAAITSDAPERREVRTSCEHECLLVSSMTFSDDWKVDVDDRPGVLLRTDGFLQGVVVPEGTHDISFRYDPASSRIGLVVSGASIVALGYLAAWRRLRRRRTPSRSARER